MNELIGLESLARLQQDKLWMLAVDGKLYSKEQGPQGFEAREPGSIAGVLSGLLAALESLNKPISVEDIQKIHKACMTGVKSTNICEPGSFRKNDVGFEIIPNWATENGLKHLLSTRHTSAKIIPVYFVSLNNRIMPVSPELCGQKNLKLLFNPQDAVTSDDPLKLNALMENFFKKETVRLMYQPPNDSYLNQQIKSIVDSYNENRKKTGSQNEQLLRIAETIQQLTRLHPFRDGNNRTFVNCLLNRMLIENSLTPALFFEPNVFEFRTPQELAEVIREAQGQFLNIQAYPKKPVFGYDNQKTAGLEKGKYVAIGEQFLHKLNILVNNLGRQYHKSNDLERAKKCFQINYNLAVATTGEQSMNAGIALFSLASMEGNTKPALRHYSESIGIFKQHGRGDLKNRAEEKCRAIEKILDQDNDAQVIDNVQNLSL
ncbi:Fic family protein [Legionella londiniensis]|uniref:Ankyrin repeat-containing protein n=1 Tax=Legionella londiniensis TaxID=45068 RepID=A0A0W0VIN3_9GAMM|nr:Fic family protein [Legionella londiniensis]KTD19915.1 ankyrin repeat-containing protein [Legionella londiniensis]STX94213.1 ankyrin repeat-containing protein [Legionella londiniensis]